MITTASRNTLAPYFKISLKEFVQDKNFPCLLAKKVFKRGNVHQVQLTRNIDPQDAAQIIFTESQKFLKVFKDQPKKLGSFIVQFNDDEAFDEFEKKFWSVLKAIRKIELDHCQYDSRVDSNPTSKHFSFSMASEAYFILLLHPQSPRKARRFRKPTIVFNPHIQFEKMRKSKTFQKVKKIIRFRDKVLQGNQNKMLEDYGVNSEILQYSGRLIEDKDFNPFNE